MNFFKKYLTFYNLKTSGKTLADPSFEMEVNAIKAFLSMQAPATAPVINPASIEISPDDYVAPRFTRKMKSKVSSEIACSSLNEKYNLY